MTHQPSGVIVAVVDLIDQVHSAARLNICRLHDKSDQMIKGHDKNLSCQSSMTMNRYLWQYIALYRRSDSRLFRFCRAEEFLQSPRLNDTSCLISDVHMPNMSGIELQRSLRDRGLKIPTIFMTAFSNESIKAGAVAAGAVCFLLKPLDTDTLIECINAA